MARIASCPSCGTSIFTPVKRHKTSCAFRKRALRKRPKKGKRRRYAAAVKNRSVRGVRAERRRRRSFGGGIDGPIRRGQKYVDMGEGRMTVAAARRKYPNARAWSESKGRWVNRWTGKETAQHKRERLEAERGFSAEHRAHMKKGYCSAMKDAKFCWHRKGHSKDISHYFRYSDPQYD